MGKQRKRRAARRKLVAHDKGIDRHSKGVSFLSKLERLVSERSRLVKRQRHVFKDHIPCSPIKTETGSIVLCQRCCRLLWSEVDGLSSVDLPCF